MTLTLALPLSLRRARQPSWAPTFELTAEVAARIDGGELGDPLAWERYDARAAVATRTAMAAAVMFGVGAFAGHHLALLPSALAGLGAAFDEARRKLGATVRLEGEALLVERGAHRGLLLARSDVVDVGFGAPALAADRRAPETFWRGDFGAVARSHVLVLRLARAPGRPLRLIIPEAGLAAAQAAANVLRAWRRDG